MPIDWEAHAARVVDRLGEDVLYTPVGGAARTVRVGFSKSPQAVVVSDVPMAVDEPRVIALLADVPLARRGDQWTIRGITYKARELAPHQPEGTITIDLELP